MSHTEQQPVGVPTRSPERQLAALLHSIQSRRTRSRMLRHLASTRADTVAQMWQERYLDDTAALLRLLTPPLNAWAEAGADACCASWCGNPFVHPHNSPECIRDP